MRFSDASQQRRGLRERRQCPRISRIHRNGNRPAAPRARHRQATCRRSCSSPIRGEQLKGGFTRGRNLLKKLIIRQLRCVSGATRLTPAGELCKRRTNPKQVLRHRLTLRAWTGHARSRPPCQLSWNDATAREFHEFTRMKTPRFRWQRSVRSLERIDRNSSFEFATIRAIRGGLLHDSE